jgi:pyruvate dehydrogenase E1 component
MIAVAGDAEFDEGNIYEALLEGWKHDIRNVWWIIDFNRQSLDAVISDSIFTRLDSVLHGMDWRVITLKYGHLLQEAFLKPGGGALQRWIDECPNGRYSALSYKGGDAWRTQLIRDLGDTHGIRALLDQHDNTALHRLMTNLGGHDLGALLDAFHGVTDDLFHRLHDQRLQPAVRGAQGQPRRDDDSRAGRGAEARARHLRR